MEKDKDSIIEKTPAVSQETATVIDMENFRKANNKIRVLTHEDLQKCEDVSGEIILVASGNNLNDSDQQRYILARFIDGKIVQLRQYEKVSADNKKAA